MDKNICNFIPHYNDYHSIHTINFVLETKEQRFTSLTPQAMYKIYYVRSGSGRLHMTDKVIHLTQGDLFFTFPGAPFAIESLDNFSYMYISFLGTRANMIMDKLKISISNFLFPSCQELCPFWEKGLNTNIEISDLITESILLYTFSFLGNKILSLKSNGEIKGKLALAVKKYVDENFTNPGISLTFLSENLSYSPKYISSTFKKCFNIGLSEYLNTIRIQHACNLMRQGFTSISDISYQCGFSDPQYFSKIFKKHLGTLPHKYIQK